MAGKQKGKDDARHLWPEVARLVGEIKPRWCFFENVPGIIKLAVDDVCADLERLGYNVGVWNFEAAAVGANHRRARIAFVAHRKSGVESEFAQRDHREEQQRDEEIRCWTGASGGDNERHTATGDRYRRGVTETFSSVVAHSGRALRQGGISRNDKNTEGFGEHKRHEQVGRSDCNLPDSDSQRELQQNGDIGDIREWPCNYREDVSNSDSQRLEEQRDSITDRQGFTRSKCGSGRSAEPRLGRVDDGLPRWLDRDWWRVEPDIPRVAKGVRDRVNRLKALGNAVVPAWAYPIIMAIMEADQYA